MQRDRRIREDFNSSSPFEGFGFQGSMFPSIFGGKDPFDDPFFTRPFGSSSGFNMSSSSEPANVQNSSRSNQLVIEELDSESEEVMKDEETHGDTDAAWSNRNPVVELPEDQGEDCGKSNGSNRKEVLLATKPNKNKGTEWRAQSFSFQKVSYGGVDGTYYTATTSRKTGNDGVTLEESKQADRTTGQATHRISRGIHDQGHSITRKLDSDGKVDTIQTLHNLDEDDFGRFEQAWNGRHLQGWNNAFDFGRKSGLLGNASDNTLQDQLSSGGRTKKVVRINIE